MYLFECDPEPEPPTEDEIGEALLWAANLAVEKHLRGLPPLGWDKVDLVGEVIIAALPSVRRFRRTGKKSLKQYCFMTCKHRMIDLFRDAGTRPDHLKDVYETDLRCSPDAEAWMELTEREVTRNPVLTEQAEELPLFGGAA